MSAEKWTVDGAIKSQRKMVEEDIATATDHYHAGEYREAAADLTAAIAEMGALAAYLTVRDGVVDDRIHR
jgi:hypothetical protein